jgi:hypothetical protein
MASQRTQTSHRDSNEAAIILSFGSPSSPTEGLKISNFPGKRHQTRHLDFCILRLLTEGLRVRVLPEYSDDEKPHGADDDFASKSLGKAFGPTSVQFERVVAPRVSV